MRLKKLAMVGFKSFADKTILHFGEGITCIVGPNGCGKSNIADAFRWVLGEQSAKSIRGIKMPDMIFAGTTHRQPLQLAEVSLTFTDVQGFLPIEYEEITVTRRLYRSGESEYFLNNQTIRLKDLQELFLDSGIGKNAFSIFEQGKLDQVISYTPLERRYIFEEAAGILRFLQRKRESLKRLEQADLNLARVQDVQGELEKQLMTLEKQAEKAHLFKGQKEQLEQFEKAYCVLKWQASERKFSDLKQKENKYQERLKGSMEQGLIFKRDYQDRKQSVQQEEKKLREQKENLLQLRNQKEWQERESQVLKERLGEYQNRSAKLKREEEELHRSQQARQKSLQDIWHRQQRIEISWKESEVQWTCQQERVKEQENEVLRLRQSLVIKQQAHVKLLQQNNQLHGELKQLETRVENQEANQKQLNQRLLSLSKEKEELIQTIEDKKNLLKKVSDSIDAYKKRLDQDEKELKFLQLELEKKQQGFDLLKRKVIELKARQKVLLKMRDEHEGFSSGSKRLLQETNHPKSPLYQILKPLYLYFEADQKTSETLALVLHRYTHTLVVEKEEDFKKVLFFAEQAELEDYSLICLEWLPKGKKIKTNSLLEKISLNAISQHFLSGMTLSPSYEAMLDAWKQEEGKMGCSLQNLFLDPHGVLFKVKLGENQLFMRESEIRALDEELKKEEDLLIEEETTLHRLQQRRLQLRQERSERDKLLRQDEMKLVEVNFGLQKALQEKGKNERDCLQVEEELKKVRGHYEEQKKQLDQLKDNFYQAQEQLRELQQKKEADEQEVGKQEHLLKQDHQHQKETRNLYEHLSDEHRKLKHESQLFELREEEEAKHREKIKGEWAELEEKKQKVFQEQKERELRLSSLVEQIREGELIDQAFTRHLDGLSKQLEELHQKWTLHQEQERKMEQELAQVQMQGGNQQTHMQAIREDLKERYQLTIEEALQLPLPLQHTQDQAEKQMRKLRQALQEAGDINLAAIEELENQRSRHTFLLEQVEDMRQAKKELLHLIAQLDGESRKLFQGTFEAIRMNFKKNFQILFNGGEADLQLTDSNNVLEAGIEISAKPPGKQMRSITLLSGGEKCLTAVALLFAIFEIKPSPFCILDEIDAPLDDTNVERFVQVIKHYVDRCQFLIITHNKRTMSIGDVLFGISMEEKGVSKLLALEFAGRETPVALSSIKN